MWVFSWRSASPRWTLGGPSWNGFGSIEVRQRLYDEGICQTCGRTFSYARTRDPNSPYRAEIRTQCNQCFCQEQEKKEYQPRSPMTPEEFEEAVKEFYGPARGGK